jgi:hypothetical protein
MLTFPGRRFAKCAADGHAFSRLSQRDQKVAIHHQYRRIWFMMVNFDVQSRADGLDTQLNDDIKYETLRAVGDYWIALVLMLIALGSSAAAGLGGLAWNWSPQRTGAIALIPGVVAVIAATMKFEGKSNWHYRKLYGFSSLKSRLLYELPLQPSADNIAGLSEERRDLIKEMEREWEAVLSLSWSQFKPHQRINTNGS